MQNVGNMRACPKLTERHIKLDSTSKMRVRLATQVGANSSSSDSENSNVLHFYDYFLYQRLFNVSDFQ